MNKIIETDKYNNVWIIKTQGKRYIIQWRAPGNDFRKLWTMTKKSDAYYWFNEVRRVYKEIYGIG